MKIKILLILGFLFFIITPSVFAASSSFFSNAQRWYNEECKKKPSRVGGENSVLCFAFDKLKELEGRLDNESGRIDELEAHSGTSEFDIFNEESVQGGEYSFGTENYRMLVINTSASRFNSFSLDYSEDNGATWIQQGVIYHIEFPHIEQQHIYRVRSDLYRLRQFHFPNEGTYSARAILF